MLAVAGYVAHSQGKRKKAMKHYCNALSVWDELGLNSGNSFDYAEVVGWQAQVTCMTGCLGGAMLSFPFIKMF